MRAHYFALHLKAEFLKKYALNLHLTKTKGTASLKCSEMKANTIGWGESTGVSSVNFGRERERERERELSLLGWGESKNCGSCDCLLSSVCQQSS